MHGDSRRRQTEASEVYAREHGLSLDTSLNLEDLGVSAFRGKNATEGALAGFLAAVKSGKVPVGSTLIVESLDRLSRDQITNALTQFLSIINAGITVVTLLDGMTYNIESVNANPGSLMMSIVIMMRAHEESASKSNRLRQTWAKKRSDASEDKKPISSRCPAWLELTKEGYRVIEGRDILVQRIFRMTAEGHGKRSIANEFNAEGVAPWGFKKRSNLSPDPARARAEAQPTDGKKPKPKPSDRWHSSYITKILNNEAVLGTYQPHKMRAGRRVPDGDPIENYFPAVISPQEWQAAHARPTAPCGPRAGKNGTVACLFSGLVIDGYTNERMRYVDKGGVRGKGQWKYLVTDPLKLNGQKGQTWPYPHFESWMLAHLKGLDWSSLIDSGTDEALTALRSTEAELQFAAAKTGKAIDTILDGFAEGPDSLRDKAKAKAAKLAAELDQTRVRLADIQAQIESASAATNSMAEGVEEFRALIGAGDPQSRQKLRMEIRRRVHEIKLYRHGGLPVLAGSHAADVKWPSVEITYTTGAKHFVLASRIGPAEHPCRRQPRDKTTGAFVKQTPHRKKRPPKETSAS